MAGDWLKVEKSTPEKPEVFAMAAALSLDPDIVFARLFKMWGWFDANTTDGNARGVTFALLDRHIGVSGFCNAALQVGWLSVTGDCLVLPNFEYHNGESAKTRALTAKRVAKHRKSNGESNGENVTGALAREEKRREEKDIPPNPQGDEGGRKVKIDETPYQEILDAYRYHLPHLPQPEDAKAWNKTRKASVKARYDENEKRQNLAWWQKYFGHVAKSAFLTGKTPENFEATFDWLMKPTNMQKVIEGNYHKVINHA